jgi:hypothetical protein
MRSIVSNHGSAYARLAWPTILIGQASKWVFNSPILLVVDDDLSIKKNLGDFV